MSAGKEQNIIALTKHFNTYAGTLFAFLENIMQNATLKLVRPIINQLINDNSNKIIDMFILSVFQYEEQILAGDDNFFLNQDFGNGKLDSSELMQVFEFKNIWKTLTEENRTNIKSYMQILCKIARRYFNLKDSKE
jgi:hypothetical protein